MTLATYEEVVDAEVVPTNIECVQSIERAVGHVNGFWDEVLWQVRNKAWEGAGYESFDELWEHRYAGLGVSVPRKQRPEVVVALRGLEQTQQQIADKLNVNQASVSRDLNMQMHNDSPVETITNSRGQARSATYNKKPKDEWPEVPPPEPEPAPERDSMTVALINDLRGPWRRGITSTAKKMTQKERQTLIEAIETTLEQLKEI